MYKINNSPNRDILRKTLASLRRYFKITTEEINNMDDDNWAILFTELQWILEQENPKKENKQTFANPNQQRKNQINKMLRR